MTGLGGTRSRGRRALLGVLLLALAPSIAPARVRVSQTSRVTGSFAQVAFAAGELRTSTGRPIASILIAVHEGVLVREEGPGPVDAIGADPARTTVDIVPTVTMITCGRHSCRMSRPAVASFGRDGRSISRLATAGTPRLALSWAPSSRTLFLDHEDCGIRRVGVSASTPDARLSYDLASDPVLAGTGTTPAKVTGSYGSYRFLARSCGAIGHAVGGLFTTSF